MQRHEQQDDGMRVRARSDEEREEGNGSKKVVDKVKQRNGGLPRLRLDDEE